MPMMQTRRTVRRMPQPTTHQVVTVPPPTSGLNTTGAIAAMPPTDAIECDNLISNNLGLSMRGGWREYAAHINSGAGDASITDFIERNTLPNLAGEARVSEMNTPRDEVAAVSSCRGCEVPA